jgi:hypothetical protein
MCYPSMLKQYKKRNEAGLMLCNVPVVQLTDSSCHVTVHWSPLNGLYGTVNTKSKLMNARPVCEQIFHFLIIKFDPGIKTFYVKNRLEKFVYWCTFRTYSYEYILFPDTRDSKLRRLNNNAKATGWQMRNLGSIPCKGKGFFSSPQCP